MKIKTMGIGLPLNMDVTVWFAPGFGVVKTGSKFGQKMKTALNWRLISWVIPLSKHKHISPAFEYISCSAVFKFYPADIFSFWSQLYNTAELVWRDYFIDGGLELITIHVNDLQVV